MDGAQPPPLQNQPGGHARSQALQLLGFELSSKQTPLQHLKLTPSMKPLSAPHRQGCIKPAIELTRTS
jgi:hypothetical protein